MKSIIFICLIVLGTSIFAVGQEKEVKVERHLLSVYFIPLKMSYELGFGKSNTVELGGGLNGVTWFDEYDQIRFEVAPFAEAYFKNYYNLDKRHGKDKRTDLNSGNYWGLFARYRFKPIAGDVDDVRFNSIFIAPVWGFQRNYKSHFSLGMDFGLGIGFNDQGSYFSPVIRLKLGFVLLARGQK